MRIAHVSDFYLPRLGGIEVHLADLSARQRLEGHDVQVLTGSPGASEPDVTRLAVRDGMGHPLNPWAVRQGLRILREAKIDVLHAHVAVGSPLAFLMARASAGMGIPTVVTVHSLWTGRTAVLAAVERGGRWGRLPIAWTAVSEAAAKPVRRLLPGHDVLTIPNGIDVQQWRPRRPRGTSDSPLTAVAVMRLSPRKRPIPLLHMFRRASALLSPDDDLRLCVVGDGPMGTRMRAYAKWHGISPRVRFAGRLDRAGVAQALADADFFLAPARLESFGIAALEARCAGLPVVALAAGGVGEYVEHEREGLICADDDEMVRAIVRLTGDHALREGIAAHNLSSPTRVAWPKVLEQLDEAYRRATLLQALEPSRAQPRP